MSAPTVDGVEIAEGCRECYLKKGNGWKEVVRCALHAVKQPEKPKRYFRVSWTEEYQKVFEGTSYQQAMEDRDDDGAFMECSRLEAQEVTRCYKAGATGRKECDGCDGCEGGWIALGIVEVA